MRSGSQVQALSPCPSNMHWTEDGLERDLYIQTNTVTVLAMDGRRRWLDMEKLVRFNHFSIFISNDLRRQSKIQLIFYNPVLMV